MKKPKPHNVKPERAIPGAFIKATIIGVGQKIKRLKSAVKETGQTAAALSFESIAQCNSVTGIPATVLKLAKKEKVAGFEYHRIRITVEFLKWYFKKTNSTEATLPEGFATWGDVLNKEKALREKIKREKDQRSVCDIGEAKAQAAEAASFYFSELERFERELPPLLDGQPGDKIKLEIARFNKELRENSRKKFDTIG